MAGAVHCRGRSTGAILKQSYSPVYCSVQVSTPFHLSQQLERDRSLSRIRSSSESALDATDDSQLLIKVQGRAFTWSPMFPQ